MCVCATGGSRAHFLSVADCNSELPAATNGTVREQTSVRATASGDRTSLREDEPVDGNAVLIPLMPHNEGGQGGSHCSAN